MVEAIIGGIAVTGIAGITVYRYFKKSGALRRELKILSNSLQFSKDVNAVSKDKFKGEVLGYPISIGLVAMGPYTDLQLSVYHQINSNSFNLVRKGDEKEFPSKLTSRVVESGDINFDEKILVYYSTPHYAAAVLNKECRKRILKLSEYGGSVRITNKYIEVITDSEFLYKKKLLVSIITDLIWISINLTDDTNLKKRIIENIRRESIHLVKYHNIKALVANYRIDEESITVLTGLLESPNILLQVEAAKSLGEQGEKHLINLLEQWVKYNSHALQIKKKKNILNDKMLLHIIALFLMNPVIAAIPVLKKIYVKNKRKDVRIAILKTFRKYGDTSISPFLCKHYTIDDKSIILHIIDAMETCGTIKAVEKLYFLGKRPYPNEVREKAFSVMLKLQARLGEVEKGWLSISELKEIDGALTLSDKNKAGILSISDEKED